ncbi:hypothetical protein ACIQ6V_15580 [Streptomyces sp. NPDC096198]|uniref:hypothetical protein n=1 Tax=Streptomyces sp. NPDC096198 TaxID=3366080 RepID=UPI0038119BE2
MVWNGNAWVESTPRTWDGSKWVSQPPVKIWDGQAWMTKYPAPVMYPNYVTANGAANTGEYRTYKLPADVRLGDFVVSICAARDAIPELLNPTGNLTATQQLTSGAWVSCVMWRYDGELGLRNGDSVRWRVPGAGDSTVANYVYRNADALHIPITPFHEIKEYKDAYEVPLNSPAGNTSLFIVLTEAKNLTNIRFPEGVISRKKIDGTFGEHQILFHAGDTPGSGAQGFGKVLFDTTVPAAAVITVKVPGMDDGKPVWILGDQTASVLGKTTYLQ